MRARLTAAASINLFDYLSGPLFDSSSDSLADSLADSLSDSLPKTTSLAPLRCAAL